MHCNNNFAFVDSKSSFAKVHYMKLEAQITFRETKEVYDLLQKISADERRRMNEMARALLERGIAAYLRDGKLFEPETSSNNHHKSTGKHRVSVEYAPPEKRRRRAG